MRKALAAAALTMLALAGCSSSGDEAGAATPTESSDTSPTAGSSPSDTASQPEGSGEAAVEIEIEGDRIEPNGRQLEVDAGEPVRLTVTSDRAAELHVHSSPEQVIEVEPGTSTVELAVDTPGLVDVEEHESGLVVLRLEVH